MMKPQVKRWSSAMCRSFCCGSADGWMSGAVPVPVAGFQPYSGW